jgi:hypothetical protein
VWPATGLCSPFPSWDFILYGQGDQSELSTCVHTHSALAGASSTPLR